MTDAAPTRPRTDLPTRMLGRTGQAVPILGLGTGPGGMGLTDEAAVDLYARALDLGVTYVDTAPGYARAHLQVGRVMRRRRGEVFLATKVPCDSAVDLLSGLERGLDDLGTDGVDLAYIHHLGGRNVDQVLSPSGSLAGLLEARSRGWTRFVGFTAHNLPAAAARILTEARVDVIMVALNFADRHTYDFEGRVLPLAAAQGVGVAAMKVFGGAEAMKYETAPGEGSRRSAMEAAGFSDGELALRYALGLPGVALAVVGMYSPAELERNVAWARRFRPLGPPEAAVLEDEGRRLAGLWGPHFGEVG
ncbi:MAG: aldo/keto reductase [Gemmatimonadota bacterium]